MLQSAPVNQVNSNQAVALFWQSSSHGWFYRLWARLTRRATRLLDLDDTLQCNQVQNSTYAGLKAVCIACIMSACMPCMLVTRALTALA